MKAGVPKTRLEVKDLERLRQLFLNAPEQSGVADYWSDSNLLKLYDQTFARRISWKWQAVLNSLKSAGWNPPSSLGRWIDWGCGSGVALESLSLTFNSSAPLEFVLSDRSSHAQKFAAEKIRHLRPLCAIVTSSTEHLKVQETDLVLLSHVLTELKESQFEALLATLEKAHSILWVEPGTPFCSRRLIAVRDRLRDRFNIVAPCPHQQKCGLQGDDQNWCHFFATAPSDIFQDSNWMSFSKELKIDLRSLPLSYLLLERKSSLPETTTTRCHNRVVGRPRFYKGHAKMLLCGPEGVNEKTLQERHHKQDFKNWKRDSFLIELTNAQDYD